MGTSFYWPKGSPHVGPLKPKDTPIKEVPFGLNIKPIELNQIYIFECEGQSHSHKSHYFTCY